MPIAHADEPSPRKPLRLWPGVVAVVLLWLARFGVKLVVPGFKGFSLGMKWGLGGVLAVLVWWAFFSRAPWSDRLGAIFLMIAGLAGAWHLRHESMGLLWLVGYAVPSLCLALVAGAAASRRLPDGPRRATMAATILLACGVWALVRTEGISGDHVAEFDWRWTKSPEERLLAQPGDKSLDSARDRPLDFARDKPLDSARDRPLDSARDRPLDSARDKPLDSARDRPAALPPAAGISKEPPAAKAENKPAALHTAPPLKTASAPLTPARTSAEWPGFRGPKRDGVIQGVRIETDWSRFPPVELWRRPIGPGWSSFAVHGDRIYTQEQRGDDEIVACYNTTTGTPVWTHRDTARFFESNAGAGPRGTPTLSNGRIYTFGATGIVNALDAAAGAVVWSRDAASDSDGTPSMASGKTKIPDWGFASSPLVVDEVVIVAVAGQLVAYDLATGKPRWFGPAGGASYSSPQLMTIDGVAQVLLVSGAGATSLAPADGKQLWQHRWRGFSAAPSIVQPAVTANGDVLIAVSGESGMRRIAVAYGPGGWNVEERWTSSGIKPYFNDFVVHKGHAFGFDGRILASIDLEDGKRQWKGGRYGNGQLVLLPDQDLLLVLSEEGELALVGATSDQYRELARFPAIEGKTWNHPVLVGDVLLVRNSEEMAAFRLSLAGR